jgi:hypothetical protein
MKKVIPAVFFQKQLNGVSAVVKKPVVLDLFESELRKVVGGRSFTGASAGSKLSTEGSLSYKGSLSYSGTDTYSGSLGWLDVEQADDCGS